MSDTRGLVLETVAGRDFHLCLGDFLDLFYRADEDKRREMIMPAPDFSLPPEQMAYLAAAVHKLANDFGLAPPCVWSTRPGI